MPRKRRELILARRATVKRPVKACHRFCFSRDGVFMDDGKFRFWTEWDDSGYGWNGCFDIINKDQLIERMKAAEALGAEVYEKIDPTDSPEGFDYERRLVEDFVRG